MAITSAADVAAALIAGDRQKLPINKGGVNGGSGKYVSMWRATGTPGQGVIPTTLATCNKSSAGAWNYTSPDTANGKAHYLAGGSLVTSWGDAGYELHDRLVHMAGLSGIVTTAQTVGLLLTDTSSNLQQRLGPADLTEIQWWLEIHTATGSTSATASVDVTNTDASTSTLSLAYPGGPAAGYAILIPPANGKVIQSIDAVTLSVTTGTAGNFGFTATRRLCTLASASSTFTKRFSYLDTELVNVYDNSCLTFMDLPSGTNTGNVTGYLNLIQK